MIANFNLLVKTILTPVIYYISKLTKGEKCNRNEK